MRDQNKGSGKDNAVPNTPKEAGQGGGRKAGNAVPEIMKKDKSAGGLPKATETRRKGG